jgi:imidazolonepropionase-like amidohydrolase
VLGPHPRVPVAEALKAVTINAAYQCGLDDVVGSLEPNKYADLVVLANDPMAVEPTAISEIQVLEIWLGGFQRFSA